MIRVETFMLMAALLLLLPQLVIFSNSIHAQVAEWKSATATYSSDSNDSMFTGKIATPSSALNLINANANANAKCMHLQKVLVVMETSTKAAMAPTTAQD